MKNIAIVMDINSKSGGKLHMAISMCKYLKKIKNYNFVYITTFKDVKKILSKELNINSELYEKNNIILRILNRFLKIFNFFSLTHPFEFFLNKHNINSIIFLDPTSLVLNIKKIPFIYSIFDIDHRNLKNLPEFQEKEGLLRDKSYQYACDNCKKLIVGTQDLKKKVSFNYKINFNKIKNIIFPPVVTSLSFNKKRINKKFNKKLKKYNNYLLYPAQFWKHKNHEYIVKSFKKLSEKRINNFNIIFTGHDKGNLINIKNLINKLNLNKHFCIFNYVTNEELHELYLNCKAVIVPTKVGVHTFPLYEAFYFKKPVIYNTENLDSNLRNKVIKLDISDINSLKKTIIKLNNKKFINKLVLKNKKYYNKIFNKVNYIKDINILLNELKN